MLDVATVMKVSKKKRKEKANYVKVKVEYALVGKDRHGYYSLFRGVAIDSESKWRRKHVFLIKRYGYGKNAEVKMICDCEDYKYRWEVALIKYKSSVKCFSNGKKPVHTNPRMVPGVCKHLLAALKWVNRLAPTLQGKIFTPRGF